MLFLHSLLCGGFPSGGLRWNQDFPAVCPHKTVAEGRKTCSTGCLMRCLFFTCCTGENSGAVRGYAIVGVLLGMLAYHRAFSPPVMWLGMKLAHGFRKIMEIVKNTLKKL